MLKEQLVTRLKANVCYPEEQIFTRGVNQRKRDGVLEVSTQTTKIFQSLRKCESRPIGNVVGNSDVVKSETSAQTAEKIS